MTIQILEKKAVPAVKFEVKQAKMKLGFNMGQKSQVVAIYDVSGSTEFNENRFYSGGIMAGLSRRILALALTLDDDGQVPVYTFNSDVQRLREPMNEANLDTYVERYIHVGGGTSYAPFIKRVAADAQAGDPVLALVFTDGDNGDAPEAERAIRDAAELPIFWMFFGVYGKGTPPPFTFLKKLDTLTGRKIDNAGFLELGLYDISDAELYASMLSEYKDYPAKAIKAGLLDASGKWNGRRQSTGLGGLFRR